jgi:hypothetical protein
MNAERRNLPTRLVSLTPPDPEAGLSMPRQDERLRIVGDVSRVSNDPRVQKALRRLAAEKVPTSVSQLVMWRLAAGMEWDNIVQLGEKYGVKAYEVTLAQEFVRHLDERQDPDAEPGRLLFQIEGTDAASEAMAAELTELLKGKTVLGLRATIGIPAQPEGPSVACRVHLQGGQAIAQLTTSDGTAENWLASGKFPLKIKTSDGKFDAAGLADGLAEGIISRLVRVYEFQKARDKGRLIHVLRIENASPLILSGLAIQGATSNSDETSRVLTSLGIPPRKYLSLPASDEVFKAQGFKQGIRVTALDLSGL